MYPMETDLSGIDDHAVMTCPKCGGYMQRYKVDYITKHLLGANGKWRCLSCEFIQNPEPETEAD